MRQLSSIVLVFILAIATPANAWSLKTHVWIAQQVLNDVVDDGAVTLAGRKIAIPAEVFAALRDHPSMYRMGNLGPDVFPDPVVGQTTTHPGVEGAWQTDDWLRHLVTGSRNPAELATAYGFLGHASGDIFAHTFVNAYAGDIFLLTDGEFDVERRHFVLEKYVEGLTPAPRLSDGSILAWGDGLDTESDGLRDLLILNSSASAQNLEAGTGLHLTAMFEARRAVVGVREATDDIIGEITDWGADTLKRYLDVQAEIVSGKLAVEAAKAAVDVQEGLLDAEDKAHQLALGALSEANDLVQKYPELFTAHTEALELAATTALAAAEKAASVASDAANEIADLESKITGWKGELAGLACKLLGMLGIKSSDCQKIADIEGYISGANTRKEALKAASAAAQKAAEETARVRKAAEKALSDLNEAHAKAVAGLSKGTLQVAIDVSAASIELRRKQIELANKAVTEAEQLQERLEAELKDLTPLVDDIKEAIDRFNPVRLLLDNWISGIDKATEEYILASSRAGRDMMLNTGNPISHYLEWWGCFSAVYGGVPVQIGSGVCEAKNALEEVNAKLDEAINQLPEVLQWLLFPARKLKEEAMEELRPHLREALLSIGRFVADDTLVDFLDLLVNPEFATREKLNEVYGVDDSGKGLLLFGDVASVVEQDLGISGGVLNVETFTPLVHSVTLAKLSLLGPEGLNQLVAELAPGYTSKAYGDPVYPLTGGRYSLLFDAVRSIDGNHQWQAFGLPYPRRDGFALAKPDNSPYGHNYFQSKSKGFRIWVDRFLRHKVFLRLFPQGVIGALGRQTQLADYPFPECPLNPFPSTQDRRGVIQNSDDTCANPETSSIPIADLLSFAPDAYRAEYFACDAALAGYRHWTIVGSFRGRAAAERFRADIVAYNSDLHAEVWAPAGHSEGKYWTVMLAACTDARHSQTALALAKMRGIADDAFVWYDLPPWSPSN